MRSSFQDDIRQRFVPQYGAIAQLIIINVGVYLAFVVPIVLLSLFRQQEFVLKIYNYLTLPADLSELTKQPWSLFSYMFLHDVKGFFSGSPFGSLFHILFNMLWLFWIGRILKAHQPDRRIWFLYICGALSGAVMYLLAYNLLPAFEGQRAYLVGASAGVTAIVIATATQLPNFGIPMFLFGTVRLKWLAVVFLFLDFISLVGSNAGGMIAHLGGAAFGFLYMSSLMKGSDWAAPVLSLLGIKGTDSSRKKSPLRVIRNEGTASSAKPSKHIPGQKPQQEEVDRILDKIARVGYDKLTKEEKQILFDASRD